MKRIIFLWGFLGFFGGFGTLYAGASSLAVESQQHARQLVLVDPSGWHLGAMAATIFREDPEDNNDPIVLARDPKATGWQPAVWCAPGKAAIGMKAVISF